MCSNLELTMPPFVKFENDSHRIYLRLLQDILGDNPSMSKELNLDPELVALCEKLLQIYLDFIAGQLKQKNDKPVQEIVPWALARKEELATRSKLVVLALQALNGLGRDSFKEHAARVFPLLVNLIRIEHSSREVQFILSKVFQSCIGPIVITE